MYSMYMLVFIWYTRWLLGGRTKKDLDCGGVEEETGGSRNGHFKNLEKQMVLQKQKQQIRLPSDLKKSYRVKGEELLVAQDLETRVHDPGVSGWCHQERTPTAR